MRDKALISIAFVIILIILMSKKAKAKASNVNGSGLNLGSNLKAFMWVIRNAEGTAASDGYSYLFGSRPSNMIRFSSFDKHPNNCRPFRNTCSTASGAYQIRLKTWLEAKKALGLMDFTPESQDRACEFLIKRRGALADVKAGRFDEAVYKCRKEWASLPGAGYNQPEKSLSSLKVYYENAGGQYA